MSTECTVCGWAPSRKWSVSKISNGKFTVVTPYVGTLENAVQIVERTYLRGVDDGTIFLFQTCILSVTGVVNGICTHQFTVEVRTTRNLVG